MAVGTIALCSLLSSLAIPQIGGDGSDGPLTPTSSTTLDTSAGSGVFQFTTIRIPAGVTVRLRGANPATLLSQGDVDIRGVLEADAEMIEPGAGGWRGGAGGFQLGFPGQGPGGGYVTGFLVLAGGAASHATPGTSGFVGPTYGSAFPFDLEGGSGGAGGSAPTASYRPLDGGGGGGAVALLANGDIAISGAVSARGGDVEVAPLFPRPLFPPFVEVPGGPGSGGAIFIRSLRSVTVTGQILATGGSVTTEGVVSGAVAGDGFVRVDAYAVPPDVSTAAIQPVPLLCELPHLRELAPMQLGQVWQPRCATAPRDVVGWWMATRTLPSPLVLSFGTLHLDPDPGGGLTLIALLPVPAAGIDPLASFDLPLPNDPRLVGMPFYSQMLNLVTATGRPWLSNLLTSQVVPE